MSLQYKTVRRSCFVPSRNSTVLLFLEIALVRDSPWGPVSKYILFNVVRGLGV